MTGSAGMTGSGQVYRVHWIPGTDTLLGTCHCGAERAAEEPVELWDWLLSHPSGHRRGHRVPPAPVPAPVRPARTATVG